MDFWEDTHRGPTGSGNLEKVWNIISLFQGLEKVWKMGLRSGKVKNGLENWAKATFKTYISICCPHRCHLR
jgi:hypothetical protein